jgi:type II secretory pathway pseudopilin PulG
VPPARLRPILFSAAVLAVLAAVLAVVLPAGIASAATVTAAGNRVWAISPAAQDHVRADRLVSPGQHLGEPRSCPICAPGACVAAEDLARLAAEDTGTAAGKEITTYYPPDRGFFDEPTSQILDTGTRIDRYGGEGGTFVSPEGTPEPMRALPPGATTRPYNIYEVVNPIEVRAGTVAPWFGQLGLGTQYELPDSVGNLIENGYLKLAEDGG